MKNKKIIMNTFLDILYPRHCPVCHNITGFRGQKICDSCREKLQPVTGPRCYKCSRPLSDPGQEYCRDCSSRRHFFEQGIGIFPYSTLLQESLYKLKYEKRGNLSDIYADLKSKNFIRTFSYPIDDETFLFMDLNLEYLYENDLLL